MNVFKRAANLILGRTDARRTDHVGRGEAFPDAMQGEWTDIDDPSVRLIVKGSEVIYRGKVVKHDEKHVGEADGALTVDLKIDDPAAEDDFQRESITGLVITPDGEFHAFNAKFASQFVRTGG